MKMGTGPQNLPQEPLHWPCLFHTDTLSKGGWESEQKDRHDGLGTITICHLGLSTLIPQTKWDLFARGRSKELAAGQQ